MGLYTGPWAAHGLFVMAHGRSMGLPWDVRGYLMGFPWDIHEMPLIGPPKYP